MKVFSDNSAVKKVNKKPQINADKRRLVYRVSTYARRHTCVRPPEARLGA